MSGDSSPVVDDSSDQSATDTPTYIRELSHRIKAGETISEVLGAVGVSPQQIDEWIRASHRVYNLHRIYAGQALSLLVDTRSNELQHLALEIDPRSILIARLDGGSVLARREQIRRDRRLRVAGGEITSSLYTAARAEAIPEKIISDIGEILGWEINFARDLRPGATFQVMYEELTRPGTTDSLPGRVLAVEITDRGRSYEAFYFSAANGEDSGYYNRRGEALGRAFQRYPVAFSRISSQFSMARYHPVLKRRRPHYGVDFAAPRGTPVKAVADGKILKAGWHGGFGRFVKIRHDAVYESGYAHLSRIARGVKIGATIKRGQVIGYVGSSGRTTGPHLHFEMHRNGKYINPLKAALPPARSLSGPTLEAFRMTVQNAALIYANAGNVDGQLMQIATAAIPR